MPLALLPLREPDLAVEFDVELDRSDFNVMPAVNDSSPVSGAGSDGSGGESFSSKTTVSAPVIHGPAATPLADANVVMNPHTCGPRVNIVSAPVVGKRFGGLGGVRRPRHKRVLRAACEPFLHRGNMVFGHEIVDYAAVVGTSSAGSFSLAGYGTNGNGAQGGASGGGMLQQMR